MVKRLEKKKEKVPFVDWFLSSNGATSVAVVILGFLAGVILLLCIGKSPAGLFPIQSKRITPAKNPKITTATLVAPLEDRNQSINGTFSFFFSNLLTITGPPWI